MLITCFQNIFLKANSYLIEIDDQLIVIDPSEDTLFIQMILQKKKLLRYIILTHEHIDHIMGINRLKKMFEKVSIVATDYTSTAIPNPKKNLSVFHGFEFVGVNVDKIILTSDLIKINDYLSINLFPCKGHSRGGMFIKIGDYLFCGDEFIFEMKTVTKLPGGNSNEVIKSFDFLKANFHNETIIYPGHGEKFLLRELKIW